MHRREFLKKAGLIALLAACSPDKLFDPERCAELIAAAARPSELIALRDVYIASGDLDAKLPNPTEENLAIHLSGAFTTRGRAFASHNLGKNWTVDGEAEIALDNVADLGGQPIYCLAGPARSVSQLTLRGNHSKLTGPRRTGAVLLYGDGSIDGNALLDFGSLGSETLVAAIVDGTGPASITRNRFGEFNPLTSDTQVTVYFTAGDREQVLHQGNETDAPEGWVQGHTIYQARGGLVMHNKTVCRIGYYGDYFATKRIKIVGNRFLRSQYGVQLQLSPTAEDADPRYFSHEDYTIGWNEIESSGANVLLNTYGPSTATRFMRGFSIDRRLSLLNVNDGATDITRADFCARIAA